MVTRPPKRQAPTPSSVAAAAAEIDTGAVYRRASTVIEPHESADELRGRLCDLGTGLLLDALSHGFGDPVPQSGEMIWADKISPSELRIDWSAPAEHVLRLVRVGGAWTIFRNRRLKVLQAELVADSGRSDPPGTIALRPRSGDGPAVEVSTGGGVELVTVQSEGRAVAPARDWINGARIDSGERFVG